MTSTPHDDSKAPMMEKTLAWQAKEAKEFKIDFKRTAVLNMDVVNVTLDHFAGGDLGVVDREAQILAAARKAHCPIIHVAMVFRPGYPEVGPRSNRHERVIKALGFEMEGQPGTDFHPKVAPQPGDFIVNKKRQSAFSGTDLRELLSGQECDTLILMGIATRGVILSTVKRAADMDYSLVVVSDACADPDPVVHQMLLDHIFPMHAAVMSTAQVLQLFSEASES